MHHSEMVLGCCGMRGEVTDICEGNRVALLPKEVLTSNCRKYILSSSRSPTKLMANSPLIYQGQFIYVKFVFEALIAAAADSASSPPPWTLEALEARLPSGSGVFSVYFHILQVCSTECEPHPIP